MILSVVEQWMSSYWMSNRSHNHKKKHRFRLHRKEFILIYLYQNKNLKKMVNSKLHNALSHDLKSLYANKWSEGRPNQLFIRCIWIKVLMTVYLYINCNKRCSMQFLFKYLFSFLLSNNDRKWAWQSVNRFIKIRLGQKYSCWYFYRTFLHIQFKLK